MNETQASLEPGFVVRQSSHHIPCDERQAPPKIDTTSQHHDLGNPVRCAHHAEHEGYILQRFIRAISHRVDSRSASSIAGLVLVSLLLCVTFSGCSVCLLAKRVLIKEPADFSWKADRAQSLEAYQCWANQAWYQQWSADPELQASSKYVAGFKDGFVDYVYAGGTGEPPPVPPRQFWNVSARNDRGHAAAADWFAGFRHGAQVARDEGYRDRVTIQSSLLMRGVAEPYYSEQPYAPELILDPSAVPLQPELVPAGPIEYYQPDELPTGEMPAPETPVVEPPVEEELPSCQEISPELEEAVEPVDEEAPEIEEQPSKDLKDLFGSTGNRGVTNDRQTRQASSEAKPTPTRRSQPMRSSIQPTDPAGPSTIIPRSKDNSEHMFRRL